MKSCIVFALTGCLTLVAGSASGAEFDANGKRLDPEPERQRQYQWTNPNTGKVIVKPYPPANIQMRQTGKSADGWTVYLEVIQSPEEHSNLAATVKGGALSSNAQGGLRGSEVWLATEPERKAAEEAARRAREAEAEARAKEEAAAQAAARAQQDFDNRVKIETIKAMYAPKVIILGR